MLRCHLGFPTCGGEFHRHSVIERENPWVIPGCSHQTPKGLFNPLNLHLALFVYIYIYILVVTTWIIDTSARETQSD